MTNLQTICFSIDYGIDDLLLIFFGYHLCISSHHFNINRSWAILMMTQQQNYKFASCTLQILQLFCRSANTPYAPFSDSDGLSSNDNEASGLYFNEPEYIDICIRNMYVYISAFESVGITILKIYIYLHTIFHSN